NRFRVDGDRAIGLVHLGPDLARVLVLPRGADRALGGHHLWISVRLKRVGAVVVGDHLPTVFAEQGGLGREEDVGDASARGLADVVLGADSVSPKEQLVPRWYRRKAGGQGWRCNTVGLDRLRRRERE